MAFFPIPCTFSGSAKHIAALEKGLGLINKLTKKSDKIAGTEIFKLYDTYGFPTEIIQEIAAENNISLDMKEFFELRKKFKTLKEFISWSMSNEDQP